MRLVSQTAPRRNPTPAAAARSWGRKARSFGFWRSIFDCALACIRDHHADDLARAFVHLHCLTLHHGKPVADKVSQQLGRKAVRNQHIESAPALSGVCEHFQGLALLGTEVIVPHNPGSTARPRAQGEPPKRIT
jgi:hypothetical protein